MASASLGFRLILLSSLHLVRQAGIVAHWPEFPGELTDPRSNSGTFLALRRVGNICGWPEVQQNSKAVGVYRHPVPVPCPHPWLCPCPCPARACSCSDQLSPAPDLCQGLAWARDARVGHSEPAKEPGLDTLSLCHSVIHGTLYWGDR